MKDLNYYSNLKYPAEVVETDEGFVASNPDLPGCTSFGDTLTEAVESLGEVRALWLEGYFRQHGDAPEPKLEDDYSGKFIVRLPRALHSRLDRAARRQSTSLNQLVVSLLSTGIAGSESKSDVQNLAGKLDRICELMSAQFSQVHAFSATFHGLGPVDYVLDDFPSKCAWGPGSVHKQVYSEESGPRDEETLGVLWPIPNRFRAKMRSPVRKS